MVGLLLIVKWLTILHQHPCELQFKCDHFYQWWIQMKIQKRNVMWTFKSVRIIMNKIMNANECCGQAQTSAPFPMNACCWTMWRLNFQSQLLISHLLSDTNVTIFKDRVIKLEWIRVTLLPQSCSIRLQTSRGLDNMHVWYFILTTVLMLNIENSLSHFVLFPHCMPHSWQLQGHMFCFFVLHMWCGLFEISLHSNLTAVLLLFISPAVATSQTSNCTLPN